MKALPSTYDVRNGMHATKPVSAPGMDLRDYHASNAMMGMLAHFKRYKPREGAPENWHEAMAQEAYEIADAMLRAREAS